jgi:pimeloyl-ACP methyl ester carboxylesterase
LSADTLKHWAEFLTAARDRDVDRARELEAKYWIDGPSRDAAQVDPVYRERARQLHRENFSLEQMTRQEEPLKPPAIDRLGEIAAPALVVIGDHDDVDLVKLANRLATEIPNASLVTTANAAHLPSLEHPDQFNRILSDFLIKSVPPTNR